MTSLSDAFVRAMVAELLPRLAAELGPAVRAEVRTCVAEIQEAVLARAPEPVLVGVREAAAMLGVAEDTVRELIRDGTIEPVHLRRRVMLRVEDVRAVPDRLQGVAK